MDKTNFDNLAQDQLGEDELVTVAGGCFFPFLHHRPSIDISYSVDIKFSSSSKSGSSGGGSSQPAVTPAADPTGGWGAPPVVTPTDPTTPPAGAGNPLGGAIDPTLSP